MTAVPLAGEVEREREARGLVVTGGKRVKS